LSKARSNISANYIGQIWSAVSVFIFVPFYLEFLGTEIYGLIGFYITLMGVLAFADAGLTASLTRDMARLSSDEYDQSERGNLLKTYEVIYFGIASFIAILIYLTAPYIASHWLKTDDIPLEQLILLIKIMGVAIALQLPANLFLGGILGLQKQVLANSLQISWSVFRGAGAIAMLYWVAPTIEVFFYWQLLSNLFYFIATRHCIWKSVNLAKLQCKFDRYVILGSWKYASGMFGMTLISIALLQLDKIIISNLLSLELLGLYTLSGTIASVPGVLGRPITRAIFPKFTLLVAENKLEELYSLYHKSSEIVSLVIIPVALTGALFASKLMFIWVGSAEIASITANVTALLILGALLQSLTAVPFHVALAFGNVSLNLRIGLLSIVIITPLLFLLIPNFGIEGAAFAWFIMNILIIPPYIYFLHRRFLKHQIKKWLWNSIFKPLFVSFPILILGLFLMPEIKSQLLSFLYISGVWLITISCLVYSTSTARKIASTYLKNWKYLC